MRTFRLAMAQMNPTVGNFEGNVQKILEYIDKARSMGADLVAFPELAITGYPPEDLLLKPAFVQASIDAVKRVVSKSHDLAVVVGFVDMKNSDVYNAAAIGYHGNMVDVYHKHHLPNYGVFDEDRYFQPGDHCSIYVINGTYIGINICEDIWHATGPITGQRTAGAELIVNINGSPYFSGKNRLREQMIIDRAVDNQVYLAYLNMVGGQDELVFDGDSLVFGPEGEIVTRGSQFTEELLVVDLKPELGSVRHDRTQSMKEPGQSTDVNPSPIVFISNYTSRTRPPILQTQPVRYDPLGEIYQALVLGTRDYVKKCGFEKAILGLSGGIDSSFTCCVAVDALGKDNIVGIAMPSRYSSDGSITDAKSVARNLGIDFHIIPIEPAHSAYLEILEPHFKNTSPNNAEENVQARIRGNILMALANKFDWLVLATGNKSEMACGYATLYGDMAGGFAAIKDVPKTLVYQLARWRNQRNTREAPIPETTMHKPPSAELKPNQNDQDNLPPYDILDSILKSYVEENRSLPEIITMGFDRDLVHWVVQMVDRNEYKRRQAPPGIKITSRAFGKDRRFPIANQYQAR